MKIFNSIVKILLIVCFLIGIWRNNFQEAILFGVTYLIFVESSVERNEKP